MEYHEAIHRLERLRRLRPKLGTETTAGLLAHLGDPHEGLTCVQVAGSNGKGSTASVLARILREAGLSVGLYTSPDLNDRRERVRVDGEKITKRAVCRFVEDIWPHVVDRSVAGDAPTFFEACTALALWEFGREDVDVAVLEVGIGGRYDATSVVDPVASAVTSVSLEHTDIIGDTVEEIARDKATVAPAERPLVTGATGEALAVVREETDVVTIGGPESGDDADGDEEAPNVRAAELEMVGPAESSVSLVGPDWEVTAETPLLGQHQAINVGIAAALARQVGDALGTGVESEAIAAGIRNVTWPGRFEVMGQEPLTVLDGAHNPDACAKLAALLDRYDYDALHLVVGAMRDKDHGGMVRALPAADRVLVAEPAVERAQASEVLAAVFESESDGAIQQCDSVLDAVGRACRTAGEDDCVLVTGSLHTVAEARDRWTRTPTAVETDSVARARSVMESADVPAEFHATHDAVAREYTYHLHAPDASVSRAGDALDALAGEHDFHNFTPDDTGTVRDLTGEARSEGDFLVVTLRADGFPRQFVRRAVTVINAVTRGAAGLDRIDRLLGDDSLEGPEGIAPASPEPLVLTAVEYPGLSFERDESALTSARAIFETKAIDHRTNARVASTIADGIDQEA